MYCGTISLKHVVFSKKLFLISGEVFFHCRPVVLEFDKCDHRHRGQLLGTVLDDGAGVVSQGHYCALFQRTESPLSIFKRRCGIGEKQSFLPSCGLTFTKASSELVQNLAFHFPYTHVVALRMQPR